MDNFNLQKFVKKSKNEFYTNLYEGKIQDVENLLKDASIGSVVTGGGYKWTKHKNNSFKTPKGTLGHAGKVASQIAAFEDFKIDEPVTEENHQSLDNEVADRIEGLLNIPMKAKFLSAGVDLINDLLEDEPFDVEDVVSHLADELTKEYHTAGDHDTAVAIDEEKEEEVHEEKEEVVKEEEGDEEVEIEDEVEVPAEVDVDLEAPTKEPDNKEVFSQLVDAYEAAKELGDEKLTRQLANTITYFNKTIIFGDEE